jgi:hypothetical protein
MTNSAVALDRRLGRVRQLAPDANWIRVLPGSHRGDLCIERWILVPATCIAARFASEILGPADGRFSALVSCASTADFETRDAIMLMTLTGGMSRGERQRVQERVRLGMAAQVETQGRYQGGRPPYGYTTESYAPHPSPRKAAEGYQMKVLWSCPSTPRWSGASSLGFWQAAAFERS